MNTRNALCALFALLAATVGCSAARGSDDSDTTTGAASAGPELKPLPVVLVTVDEASRDWIGGLTSTVDGAPVGTNIARRREGVLLFQRAVNAAASPPAFVHYAYFFTDQDEGRKITDAFSEAVDDSPVPVVLELTSASKSTADGTVYHQWSLSDPPHTIITDSPKFVCDDSACSGARLETTSGNFALDGFPVGVRTAQIMAATGASRSKASSAAKRDLGGDKDEFHASSSADFRTTTLKEVLTNKGAFAKLAGAAIVVAPDVALSGGAPTLDQFDAALVSAIVGSGNETEADAP